MKATMIGRENAVFYLPIVPEELAHEATVLIGVQDEEETACGVLAAAEQAYGETEGKILNLLYIYVHSDYRGRGAGTEMLSFLIHYAMEKGYEGIQTQYPSTTELMPLWRFLTDMGFETDEEEEADRICRIPLRLYETILPQKKTGVSEKTVFLSDLDRNLRNAFLVYSREHRLLPVSAYDPTISCAAFDGQDLKAAVLFRKYANGDIEVRDMVLVGENRKLLENLLVDAFAKVKQEMGEDVHIRSLPSGELTGKHADLLTKDEVEIIELTYQLMVF